MGKKKFMLHLNETHFKRCYSYRYLSHFNVIVSVFCVYLCLHSGSTYCWWQLCRLVASGKECRPHESLNWVQTWALLWTTSYCDSCCLQAVEGKCNINSFAAAGDYSRHPGLAPQATSRQRAVHSAPLSTEVDIYCMLVKFTTYCILMGCGKLCTVVYFQKINRRRKS